MNIHYLIIFTTCLISILAWRNKKIFEEFIFYPYQLHHTQFSILPFILHGFIHVDFIHLLFNMVTLYFFGDVLLQLLQEYFGFLLSQFIYLLIYFLTLILSVVPTYFKQKANPYYRCLGASGAVSAILFSTILLKPTIQIGIFLIPFSLPGFIFAPLFLILTAYLAKNLESGINHSAHLWGSIWGIFLTFLAFYFLKDINLLSYYKDYFSELFN